MERKQCRQLRVMFVSALEPYFEVYRSGKDRPPRKAQYYRRENLDPKVRDPRWENDRIKNHISVHRTALKYLDENVPWVMHRWGATLAEGLRDERHVKAAAHEPVLKVM